MDYKEIAIARTIKGRILSGHYLSDQQLPSVLRFAAEFKVLPTSIQKAFDVLEEERFVSVVPRVGSFVVYNNGHSQKYLVEDILRKRINSHVYEYFLPTRRELELEFSISRTELNFILASLEEESLVHRDGSGTIYAGKDGKERYLSMLFRREFPNGAKRWQVAETDNSLYRRLLRNGVLQTLIPANPVAVELGREWGTRNKKS